MARVNIVRRPDPKAELGYVCPECKEWSAVASWKEAEVECEDCGEHSALECPLCEERIDKVFTDFEDADTFLAAEAEKASRPATSAPRSPTAGPEPHARLGDDVVVCDYDWDNPMLGWPRTWLFHDIKRGRALFQARKSDVGDDPPVEVLVALLLAFSAGERLGKDAGRDEGRAALAGEMRSLIGVPA